MSEGPGRGGIRQRPPGFLLRSPLDDGSRSDVRYRSRFLRMLINLLSGETFEKLRLFNTKLLVRGSTA